MVLTMLGDVELELAPKLVVNNVMTTSTASAVTPYALFTPSLRAEK